MNEKADYEYSKANGFLIEAKEKPTVTIHGSHGQATPFDYSVMNKDGTGDCYFWTTTPPTVDGLYRARYKEGLTTWVYFIKGAPFVLLFGSTANPGMDWFTHWLGPLPAPEPPKGE